MITTWQPGGYGAIATHQVPADFLHGLRAICIEEWVPYGTRAGTVAVPSRARVRAVALDLGWHRVPVDFLHGLRALAVRELRLGDRVCSRSDSSLAGQVRTDFIFGGLAVIQWDLRGGTFSLWTREDLVRE